MRGDNYQIHQVASLRDLLLPQSDILVKAFGVSGEDLVSELERIWHSLTFGMQEAMESFSSVRTEVMDDVLEHLTDETTAEGMNFHEHLQSSLDRLGCKDEIESSIGSVFGMDLFDVGYLTSLPNSFLDEFSWMPGQDTDFLAAGEFSGWPLRIWPTFKRPFVKIGGRYYCFDTHSLFDNFFRQIEKKVFQRSEDEKQAWITGRKTISESLPIQYFLRLLPGATVYQEVYYQSQAAPGGPKNWCEADCLILFDNRLFVIEVKAGAFTYTSPATDLPAYISSLKALLQSPAKQGQRFVNYLQSFEVVSIFDASHHEIAKLTKDNLRAVTICTVTLDPFTEIAAQAQHLHKIGVEIGSFPTWPISLSDLRVFADIFQGPLEFIHFVEQRMRATDSMLLELDDELDQR